MNASLAAGEKERKELARSHMSTRKTFSLFCLIIDSPRQQRLTWLVSWGNLNRCGSVLIEKKKCWQKLFFFFSVFFNRRYYCTTAHFFLCSCARLDLLHPRLLLAALLPHICCTQLGFKCVVNLSQQKTAAPSSLSLSFSQSALSPFLYL